jgi:hypothetical protein
VGLSVSPTGFSGGLGLACMRDIFILNEIRTQDKIYILVGTSLNLNILLIISLPVLALNYKQHNLSLANVIKVCYSVAEHDVQSCLLGYTAV